LLPGSMTSSTTTSTGLERTTARVLFAAARGQHLEVLGVEASLQQLDVGEDVVNDKNAGSHTG
jgi:hypothetical protein